MKLLTDRSLNTKLVFGFGGILLIASITLVLSLLSFRNLNERFNSMVETNVQALKMSPRLHRNVMEVRAKEKALLLAENEAELQQILYELNGLKDEFSSRLDELGKLKLAQASIDALNSIRETNREYEWTLNRIVDFATSGKLKDAIQLSRTDGNLKAEKVTEFAKKLTELQDSQFQQAKIDTDRSYESQVTTSIWLMVITTVLAFLVAWGIGLMVVKGIARLIAVTERIATGDLEVDIGNFGADEIGLLAASISRMQTALRVVREQSSDQDWLKSGVGRISDVLLGQEDKAALATTVITEVAEYLGAKVGAIYVADRAEGGPILNLLGTYAYTQRKNLSSQFKFGESLVGQAALEGKQILIQNAPDDYIRVVSGLGEANPTNICVTPIMFDRTVRGVMEIGTLEPLSELELDYLEQAVASVATAFEIAENQTQLKMQQEELRASNEELEEQTRTLELSQQELKAQQVGLESANTELEAQMQRVKDSEEELKAQQEELEATNIELQSKNGLLEQQKVDIESARRELQDQTEELSLASKYKSEFLANMSHELRTPLNSLLLLARSLRENQAGNMNAEQIETAGVIYDSGSDLLNLINEILDLSKIEAGKMDLRLQRVEIKELMRSISLQFEPMAKSQGLTLNVDAETDLPDSINTDPQRLGQIIKNLTGNALKFTESGTVAIHFGRTALDTNLSKSGLDPAKALMIQVKDTGIGIPLDKQKIIFEAFQQADSGDRRRFGGTGLGLSISRELAGLLGGEIQLSSKSGEGSTFSVYIPFQLNEAKIPTSDKQLAPRAIKAEAMLEKTFDSKANIESKVPSVPAPIVKDDRNAISDKDRVVLVIEDDIRFAQILAKHCQQRNFKCLIALTGEEGLELARRFRPDGIVLDIQLPNMDGWEVLTDLKQNVETRHIPVHIVSAEDESNEGMRIGAIGHASKPVQKEDIEAVLKRLEQASAHAEKWVLVVEDDEIMRSETVKLIGNGNVKIKEVDCGQAALQALLERKYALMVLDLGLPDMQGLELLNAIAKEKIEMPPVIVYTVRELSMEEEVALRQYADSIILKDVRSQERLIDEVALFLHRVVSELPEDKKRIIRHLHESDEHLKGRKILIVEDDMRTMFAMTKVLAGHGLNPIKAENGQKALDVLQSHSDIDLVLMDMMMPVMDGYEAMQRIREMPQFFQLPIIALTAKAMKEDRKKCMEAGATDYLSKPVDQDRLLSLVRVWLCR